MRGWAGGQSAFSGSVRAANGLAGVNRARRRGEEGHVGCLMERSVGDHFFGSGRSGIMDVMGYNLELSQRGKVVHTTDLCTNGGYSALCDWIGSLPTGKYPCLERLAANGEFAGTDRLVADFNRALLGDDRPADPDVFHVADRFADLLGRGAPTETASVTQ